MESNLWILDETLKKEIVKRLWRNPANSNDQKALDKLKWKSYFEDHYIARSSEALTENTAWCAARTHRDVVRLAGYLRQGLTKPEIKVQLESDYPWTSATTPEQRNTRKEGAIALVIRILLMIDVGRLGPPGIRTGNTLQWNDVTSLRQFLASASPYRKTLPQDPKLKIPSEFNARSLEKKLGATIEWTTNLDDHLKVDDFGRRILVFHYASFLKYVDGYWTDETVFPDGFISETIVTLALLFPSGDNAVTRWVSKRSNLLARHLHIDTEINILHALGEDERLIAHFEFWNERLEALVEMYQDAPPRGFKKLGVAWRGVLIALVLTAFFGLVQSAEGAIQIYKAYHPNNSSS